MSSQNAAYILWLEARRASVPNLLDVLQQHGYRVKTVTRGREALALLAQQPPALIVIYAAALGSSGRRLSSQFARAAPNTPQLVIVDQHQRSLPEVPVGQVLRLPLSERRLLHAVRRFLLPPGADSRWQIYGPIWFDPVNRRVRCHGREHTLTPKTARLLAYFLQHPNRVISREELYQAVWDMPSNNDLRTLQVHVCWLRKALEENPRRPRLLKTVRGQGYMLVLPASSEDAPPPSGGPDTPSREA